jgi:hypothetical protein
VGFKLLAYVDSGQGEKNALSSHSHDNDCFRASSTGASHAGMYALSNEVSGVFQCGKIHVSVDCGLRGELPKGWESFCSRNVRRASPLSFE